MGQIRVGTAGWTDKSLIDSSWYPPDATTSEKRLRYHALPAEQTAAAWAARTPAGFTFNVKAFSVSGQFRDPQ
jgi:uncharacterized protein YecE (DUF72 family)